VVYSLLSVTKFYELSFKMRNWDEVYVVDFVFGLVYFIESLLFFNGFVSFILLIVLFL